jgi:hypothetical protein
VVGDVRRASSADDPKTCSSTQGGNTRDIVVMVDYPLSRTKSKEEPGLVGSGRQPIIAYSVMCPLPLNR